MYIIIKNQKHDIQNVIFENKKKAKLEFSYDKELFLLNGFYLVDNDKIHYCEFENISITSDFKHTMTLRYFEQV